ncbi:FMN-binding protein [Mariniphaga sediminis]
MEVGKDIDAISGATVSVHAITDDVQWKTKLFQEMAR